MGTRHFRKRKKHEKAMKARNSRVDGVCFCACAFVCICGCAFVYARMHMYLCVHVCLCVYVYICVFMHVPVFAVSADVWMYMSIGVSVCSCMYVYMAMRVHMCACVCLYMHVHMCVSSCMAVWWDWQRRGGGSEYKGFHISERSSARSGRMMKVESGQGGP